jgi:magnesium transporter
MKEIQLYLSDLKELLGTKDFASVRSCLKEISPIDLAEGWDYFVPEERVVLFRLSPRQRAIQLFEELDGHHQVELVNTLQKEDAEKLLQELDPSETGRMVRGLPPPMMRHMIGIMKKAGLESVQRFLEFPLETVGALMRGRFLTLDSKWTSKQALERVQLSTRLRHIEETYLDTMIVAGPDGKLEGVVGLKVLVVAPREMTVRELMDPSPITLRPEMDQEEAVRLFTKYKLKSAPVTTGEGILVGIVVYRDIFRVASAEVEEDFAKMVGSRAGMLSQSAFKIAAARLPWLVATCAGGLVVSSIIKHFEPTLSRFVALATFIPLIAGMGGNVGSQTATVMVRGLATGEIDLDMAASVVIKEILSGTMIALFYGIVVGAMAYFIYGSQHGWRFACVVATAMMVSMSAAATLGAVQPLVFQRFGIDPATATAPFITTTTDLLSNLVYFSLAAYLLM